MQRRLLNFTYITHHGNIGLQLEKNRHRPYKLSMKGFYYNEGGLY